MSKYNKGKILLLVDMETDLLANEIVRVYTYGFIGNTGVLFFMLAPVSSSCSVKRDDRKLFHNIYFLFALHGG